MTKVFICSPYSADTQDGIDTNVDNARAYCALAVSKGYLPIAPHIYFTQFLNDHNREQRAMGMAFGMKLLQECDEMWVFGKPSNGMQQEIEVAKRIYFLQIKFIDGEEHR
jgi:hypothetical protein